MKACTLAGKYDLFGRSRALQGDHAHYGYRHRICFLTKSSAGTLARDDTGGDDHRFNDKESQLQTARPATSARRWLRSGFITRVLDCSSNFILVFQSTQIETGSTACFSSVCFRSARKV